MELRQLEYFVAVAEEASFTRAAERLHVAQPGVSAQIRVLERELGQELFERSPRSVRLTRVGTAVLEHARAALQATSAAHLVVDELTGLLRGQVSIGMVVACASADLTELLAEFHLRHPAVEIALSEANSDLLLERVRTGELDLAFVALGGSLPFGVETLIVVDEPVVAAVAAGDPLAKARSIPLDALRERALVAMPRGTGLRACIDAACAVAGFEPKVALEASNPATVAQLAARGLGVAILPESTVASLRPTLHPLRVSGHDLRGQLAFAWRRSASTNPAGRALVELARSTHPGSRERAPSARRG